MTDITVDKAAIRLKDGTVISKDRPARHADILMFAYSGDWDIEDCAQGFVSSTGRFLTRQEAWDVTTINGQRIAEHSEGTLFTEDLW